MPCHGVWRSLNQWLQVGFWELVSVGGAVTLDKLFGYRWKRMTNNPPNQHSSTVVLTDAQPCQRWKDSAVQRSSCLCQVNPHSHHSSPSKLFSTKSHQAFVPAWEINLRGKLKSNISKRTQEPMVFKGPLKERAVGFLLTLISH